MLSDREALVGMLVLYFGGHPQAEANALDVLRRAHLSSRLGKTVEINSLRQSLDMLLDLKLLKLRKSGGNRFYSWAL